jgi:Domain of unknown function (DUF4160)
LAPTGSFAIQAIATSHPTLHVERDREVAKFWLQPVRLQNNQGFSRTEINRIQKLIQENQEQLLAGWHDFFND